MVENDRHPRGEIYYRGQGFVILKKEALYQISWLVGAFGEEVCFPISEERVKKAMRSAKEAYAVMMYVETGFWPPTEEGKEQATKAFLRRHPDLLLKIPDNQKNFDQNELKSLLARGRRILEK